MSARVWSQLDSTKTFPLPGLKIAFAPVPCLESILQLMKACYFFSPACCSLLIPFGAPKLPCFALSSWDSELVQKHLFEARLVGGEEDPGGSWSCLCWCSMEGRNQIGFSWAFFGLVFPTAQQEGFQCPGKVVRVWAQTSTEVASISWGCQNTQQQRVAVAKGGRLDEVAWAWP